MTGSGAGTGVRMRETSPRSDESGSRYGEESNLTLGKASRISAEQPADREGHAHYEVKLEWNSERLCKVLLECEDRYAPTKGRPSTCLQSTKKQ